MTLKRAETVVHAAPGRVDPFEREGIWGGLVHSLLSTALFRCWHIILFFAGWSTAVTAIHFKVHHISIQATLLTVIGTVLGFVISYRTTSSFERYNEGRKYWSQIVLASRSFARYTWFHIPELVPATEEDIRLQRTEEERAARVKVEKKTAINLIEAFAVSVKHYLRGEDGIFYEDLYHLIKFLPAYDLPAGLPAQTQEKISEDSGASGGVANDSRLESRATTLRNGLPPPVTVSASHRGASGPLSPFRPETQADGTSLQPAYNPPQYALFDLWPLSLLVKTLTKRGVDLKGKKAARYRAKTGRGAGGSVVSYNIPHEITLYLSSYIAALVNRKSIDVATQNQLINSLNSLADALTGLERILTTPIPFSYSFHLWVVTFVYCLLLPFQTLTTLNWITIPGTVLAAFIFFGFLVAGEEIENPFGYDKNDLNLDHFTKHILRSELRSITSRPAPDLGQWAFHPDNEAWSHELRKKTYAPDTSTSRNVDVKIEQSAGALAEDH